jgi:hypothetical protein
MVVFICSAFTATKEPEMRFPLMAGNRISLEATWLPNRFNCSSPTSTARW